MRLIPLFLILVLLAYPVLSSAGVRGPAEELRQFDYEPGKVVQTSFYIYGAESLDLLLEGAMVDHAEVIDPDPHGGARTVTVKLTMPDYLAPGEYKLYVGSLEKISGGQVGGRAGAMMSMQVRVLADYPAIKSKFSVANTALDADTTTASLEVESWTRQDLKIVADILVFNASGGQIRKIRTEQFELPSNTVKSTSVTIPTKGLPRGYYKSDAHIYYASNMSVAEDGFLIGDVDLLLNDYTKTLTRGKINKFDFRIQSDWNQHMHNVNAELMIDDSSVGRSPSVDIKPFTESKMEIFVDASDLEAKNYNATLTLRFENRQKNFPITLSIVDLETPASVQAQKPERNFSIPINSMTILYFLVALLVLINIYLVFRKSEKKK